MSCNRKARKCPKLQVVQAQTQVDRPFSRAVRECPTLTGQPAYPREVCYGRHASFRYLEVKVRRLFRCTACRLWAAGLDPGGY